MGERNKRGYQPDELDNASINGWGIGRILGIFVTSENQDILINKEGVTSYHEAMEHMIPQALAAIRSYRNGDNVWQYIRSIQEADIISRDRRNRYQKHGS